MQTPEIAFSNGIYYFKVKSKVMSQIQVVPPDFCSCLTNRKLGKRCMHLEHVDRHIAEHGDELPLRMPPGYSDD